MVVSVLLLGLQRDFVLLIFIGYKFLAPVAILAASFCILSSSCFSYQVQLLKMTSEYSRRDLMEVYYYKRFPIKVRKVTKSRYTIKYHI